MATWYKINASAKLTVRADSLNVRSGPQLYDFVKSVKAGEDVYKRQALSCWQL